MRKGKEARGLFTEKETIRFLFQRKYQFPNIAEYYSTVFHELGHSTMKENSREDLSYAQEELVAEITASTLCGMFHLENRESGENHVAYLKKSWLKHVKEENPKALVSACYAAQKASDLVLGNRKIFLEERNRQDWKMAGRRRWKSKQISISRRISKRNSRKRGSTAGKEGRMKEPEELDMVEADKEILLFMQYVHGEIDADEYLQELMEYDRRREKIPPKSRIIGKMRERKQNGK